MRGISKNLFTTFALSVSYLLSVEFSEPFAPSGMSASTAQCVFGCHICGTPTWASTINFGHFLRLICLLLMWSLAQPQLRGGRTGSLVRPHTFQEENSAEPSGLQPGAPPAHTTCLHSEPGRAWKAAPGKGRIPAEPPQVGESGKVERAPLLPEMPVSAVPLIAENTLDKSGAPLFPHL